MDELDGNLVVLKLARRGLALWTAYPDTSPVPETNLYEQHEPRRVAGTGVRPRRKYALLQ